MASRAGPTGNLPWVRGTSRPGVKKAPRGAQHKEAIKQERREGKEQLSSKRALSILRDHGHKSKVKGDKINLSNVYFAMPSQKDFMTVRNWKTDLIAEQDYKVNDPIKKMKHKTISNDNLVSNILIQVKGMLREARILLKPDQKFEISHHYGLGRFREFGAVIINLINREYCKKLIIQLPRQKHPYHHHKKKEGA